MFSRVTAVHKYASRFNISFLDKDVPQSSIVISAKELEKKDIFSLFIQKVVSHIHLKDPFFFEELLIATWLEENKSRILKNPSLFWNLSDRDPIEKLYYFRSSTKKDFALTSLKKDLGFLSDKPIFPRIITTCDELLGNALFNAPVNKDGHSIYKNKPKNEHIEYPDEVRDGRFFISIHESCVLIGCVDPFGSIDVQEFFGQTPETRTSRGLTTVLSNSTATYIIVSPGNFSLVGCRIPIRQGVKFCEEPFQTFHVVTS